MFKTHAIAAAAGAGLAALAVSFVQDWRHGEAIQRYETRIAEMRRESADAVAQANAVALEQTKTLQERKDHAEQAHAQEIARLQAAAADAGRTADRLRHQLATDRLSMSIATRQALTDYATTAGQLLAQCADEYRSVAAAADRHAADVRMMLEAWPSN